MIKLLATLLLISPLSIALASNQTAQVNDFEFSQSEAKAKEFFLNSVINSLKNLEKSERPIQVDLYIAVHFLMYNETLHFTDNQKISSQLSNKTVQYFQQQLSNNHLMEGCLASKLLIALAQTNAHPEFEKQLAQKYFDWIETHWNNKGIGECFIPAVERTYGENRKSLYCTPSTQELEAKILYYLANSHIYSTQNIPFSLPTINTIMYDEIDQWWKANVELWIIKNYHHKGEKFITPERYNHARRLVEKAVTMKQDNTIVMPLIAYGYLLTHAQANTDIMKILRQLKSMQRADGAIPSAFTQLNKPGHNIDASPTYFYLLALNELKKKKP